MWYSLITDTEKCFFYGGTYEIKSFFKGVKSEIKMVRWPSGKDMLNYSGVVLCMMVFFGIFFYVLDVIFTFLKGAL